jgi:hypothetical protein
MPQQFRSLFRGKRLRRIVCRRITHIIHSINVVVKGLGGDIIAAEACSPLGIASHPCDKSDVGRLSRMKLKYNVEFSARSLSIDSGPDRIFTPARENKRSPNLTTGQNSAVITGEPDWDLFHFNNLVEERDEAIWPGNFKAQPEKEFAILPKRDGCNLRWLCPISPASHPLIINAFVQGLRPSADISQRMSGRQKGRIPLE